jgi:hypothetical protein
MVLIMDPEIWFQFFISVWHQIIVAAKWLVAGEHKFQLIITGIAVLPATVVSIWALINQLRQTATRIKVRPFQMQMDTLTGPVLSDPWSGVEIRNLSGFPVYIRGVGFRIDGRLYGFGRPLNHRDVEVKWPYELAPHRMCAFRLRPSSFEGRRFINGVKPLLKEKFIWEVGTAYAITETDERFYSKKIPRKALRQIRELVPPDWLK